MSLKHIFLFLILLISFHSNAQVAFHKLLADVPSEDLKMTTYEQDSTASAVILEDKGDIRVLDLYDKYTQVFKHFRRIKILSRSGFDRGDIEIPFYSFENSEFIKTIDAVITLPDGTQHKLDKKDFFIEEVNKYFSHVRFTFPQLVEGAVIDYYYVLHSSHLVVLNEWHFQEDIPIRNSELTYSFDGHFSYLYLFQGFDNMQQTKEGEKTFLTNGVTNAVLHEKGISVQNAVALKEEPFITTQDDYRLRVRFQLAEYLNRIGEKDEILSDWETLVDGYLKSDFFGKQYIKRMYCGKLLKAAEHITAKDIPNLEKATELYDFLNKKVQLDNVTSVSSRKSLNDAFEKGKATNGEINLMLLALFRAGGIESHPFILSRRNHGKPMPKYPIQDQFNHVVVYAEIEGKEYLIEAGNDLRPLGLLAVNSLNGKGLLLKKEDWVWKDIVSKQAKEVYKVDLELNEDENLNGKIVVNYRNHASSSARYDWTQEGKEGSWKKALDASITDYEIEKISAENETDVNKPFMVTLKGDFSGAAQIVNDFVYINPLFLASFSENPFKSEVRYYAVDFPYPLLEQFIVNIRYPTDKYTLEALPEAAKIILPDKSAIVRYNVVEKEAGLIQIVYLLNVKGTYFRPNTYEALRTLFDMVSEKLGEQVVLKEK